MTDQLSEDLDSNSNDLIPVCLNLCSRALAKVQHDASIRGASNGIHELEVRDLNPLLNHPSPLGLISSSCENYFSAENLIH